MVEARKPMGLRKDLHIGKILEDPAVIKRWTDIKGKPPAPSDVDVLFKDFVPMQMGCLDKYSTIIPGVVETVNILRNEYKCKIGSTTGFTKLMVDKLLENTKKQGYAPDTSVAGDEVPNNMGWRPAPFMVYQNLVNLGVFPIESVVKVDDTIGGVGEGLNAGCWSVAIAGLSNYTNVDSLEEWDEMSGLEKKERVDMSRNKLIKESGAHYIVDAITDLPTVILDINGLGRI